MLIAYCFRDGAVQAVDGAAPEGAIELFRGPNADVERLINDTTDNLGFIAGLRETTTVADDQQQLLLYLEEARDAASRLITVNDLSRDILEADREVA